MELEYIEDIKDDIDSMISSDLKHGSNYKACVGRVIHENDYYMSSEKPIEEVCHYIAIGAYTVETNNINELLKLGNNDKEFIEKVIMAIKRSIDIIESGKYDSEFTEEDKKSILKDIEIIKSSELLK